MVGFIATVAKPFTSLHSLTRAQLIEQLQSLREELEALRLESSHTTKTLKPGQGLGLLLDDSPNAAHRTAVMGDREGEASEGWPPETNEWFRFLFEQAPIGMAIATLDGRYVRVNQSFCDTLGYTASELEGRTFLEITHPEDVDDNRILIEQLLEGTLPHIEMEKRYISKAGQTIYGLLKVGLFRNANGQAEYTIGQVIDITEQKRAEHALHRAHQELENRVQERTKELSDANDCLKGEIGWRESLQEALHVSEHSIRQLCEITANPNQSYEQDIRSLLELGCSRFKLSLALLVRHTGNDPVLEFFYSPQNLPAEGNLLPVCESICDQALLANESIGIAHVGASAWRNSRAYTVSHIEACLGTTVNVGSKIYGTLCFMGYEPLSGRVAEADKDFLQLMSRWIGGQLEQAQGRDLLETIVKGTATSTGIEFFDSLVKHLATALGVRYAFVVEWMDSSSPKACTLSFWNGTGYATNFEYILAGTPCENVGSGEVYHAEGVRALYPHDKDLVTLNAEGYFGIPFFDRCGKTIGHLAVVHDGPMHLDQGQISVMRIFAARAGVELERKRAESALSGRNRQQKGVAHLGQRALAGVGLARLMDEAVSLVTTTLNVEYGQVLELLPDTKTLLLVAGVGWKDGQVGRTLLPAGKESQAGYTLVSNHSVVVDDLSKETRFSGPPLLHEHGVISGMSVLIEGKDKPFGVLSAHSRQHRSFTHDDVHFVQGIANVLAAVIERERTEEALRTSEEQLALAVKGSSDGLWDGRVRPDEPWYSPRTPVWWSPQFKAMLGYEENEFPNVLDSWASILHPDDKDRVFSALSAHIERQAPYDEEYRLRTKSGDYRWYRARGQAIWDQAGNPLRMSGSLQDITERKEAEQALKASEAKYSDLYEHAPDMFASVDEKTGIVLQCNQTLANATGHTKNDIVGRHIFEMYHPDCLKAARRAFGAFRETGQIVDIDLELKRKNGEKIDVALSVSSVRDQEGKILCSRSIWRDITRRKQAERKLHRYEQIAAGTSDFLAFIDNDLKYQEINASYLQAFGKEREEIIGFTGSQLFGHKKFEAVLKPAQIRCLSGEQVSYETWLDFPGLGRRYMDVHYTPYYERAGQISGLVVAVRDISQRKQAEESLRENEQRLLQLIEDRERISQDLHDGILQSLYSVGLELETAKLLLRLSPGKTAKQLDHAMNRLTLLTQEVRSFLSGLKVDNLQGENLEGALKQLVESFSTGTSNCFRTRLDREAATQVSREEGLHLLNITREAISNSLRHGKAQKIEISLQALKNSIRLCVKEDGRGFDLKVAAANGFGLGNMMSRARKIGGLLKIDSRPGHGTRITFDLPREKYSGKA